MSYNQTLKENIPNTTSVMDTIHDLDQESSVTHTNSSNLSTMSSAELDVNTQTNHGHRQDHTDWIKSKGHQDNVDIVKDAKHHIKITHHLKTDHTTGEEEGKSVKVDNVGKLNIKVKDKPLFSDMDNTYHEARHNKQNQYSHQDLTSDDDSDTDDLEVMYDYVQDQMMNDFAPVSKTSKNNNNNRRARNKYRDNKRNRKSEEKDQNYSNEYRIKRDVLNHGYDKTSRPVRNDSTTVMASVGMSLFHILDTVSVVFHFFIISLPPTRRLCFW